MKRPMRQRTYLTPQEVAERLMVSPVTVRQWAQKGLLSAIVTPGGHRRFLREEVSRFAKDYGMAPGHEALSVLIVEDDRQFARYLEELLAGLVEGVVIDIALDGFEAGRKVQAMCPAVVLLDLMMPGLDGFEVCAQLKADVHTHDVRIIAMTGHGTDENIARILKAGAECCLTKPIDKASLIEALRKPST